MCPVSIIVPVYNSEPYLKLSIESILAQTFSDFELIIVDDGSTDNSGKICDEYAKKDNRIKVIHTENQGSAMARNKGLDIAQGEYVAMIDSDDYVGDQYIEELYNIAKESNADIAFHDFYWFFKDSDITPEWHGVVPSEAELTAFTRDEMIDKLINDCRPTLIVPMKLYRRELFDNIRFPNVRKNDDEWIIHHLFLKAKKAIYTSSQCYFYRFTEKSQTRGNDISKDNFSGILALADRIDALVKNGYTDKCNRLFESFFFNALKFYTDCTNNGIRINKEMKYIKKHLKQAYRRCGFSKRRDTFSRRDLLSLFLFSHSLTAYRILNCKYSF